MVLPGSILFPGAMLPLHIFEERYRKMLSDSLSSHRLFCVGTVRENPLEEKGKEVYKVLGIGIIRVALENPDGSSNIIIQGISRARILNFTEGKPYPSARIEILSTDGNTTDGVDALSSKVAELALTRAKLDHSITKKTLAFLTTLSDPSALSDLISFSMLGDWHDQQAILETLNIERRLRKLASLLQREIDRLLTIKSLQRKMNKKKIALN